MLFFVLGRAGSGKTTHVRKLLGDFVKISHESPILIVPEQYSFESQRKMLELLGNEDAQNVEVTSFTRLAEAVLTDSGRRERAKISEAGRTVLMSLALEQVADSLSVYGKSSKNIGVLSEMLGLSKELKQCAVSPIELEAAAQQTQHALLQGKLRDVSVILSAYDALVDESFEEQRDTLTLAARELAHRGYFCGKIVALDAFRGFTRQELEIVELIIAQAKMVYVSLCTDVIYSPEPDMSVFAHTRQTARRLIELAKKHNVPVTNPARLSGENKFNNFPPMIRRFESDALRTVENGLYSPEASVFAEKTDDVTVCAARDAYAECDYVALRVRKLLREEGYRCRDIAVISRGDGEYSKAVKASFRKYGVPVFEDKRQSVAVQPLVVLVRSALEIASNGYSSDAVMRVLKTGLTDVSSQETSILENYAYMWNLGGMSWLAEQTASPGGLTREANDDEKALLAQINEIRARAVEPLERLRSRLRRQNGKDMVEAVYRYLEEVGAGKKLTELAEKLEATGESALAVEQERIWDMLMEVFDQCASALGDRKLSVKRFAELLGLVLSTGDVGDIPDGLDEILVGSADRIRASSPKCVFVVGVNEGVFPRNDRPAAVFTPAERKRLALQGVNVTQSGEYHVLEERFISYSTLCCASEKLFVCYPAADFSGTRVAPSELVSQVLHLVPNCERVDTAALSDEYRVEGEQPTYELCAELWNSSTPLSAALKEYFSGRVDYSDRLEAVGRMLENKPFAIENKENATKLFGQSMNLSASRTQEYHQCPFKYFLRYGINAKPIRRAELSADVSGTVVHFVLENVVKKYGAGLASADENEVSSYVGELLGTFLETNMGGSADKSKRFIWLYNSLCRAVMKVVHSLAAEFAQSDFEPVDFELPIGSENGIRAYEVQLEDGGRVYIRGVVDRVDVMKTPDNTFLRVVDYKTGSKKFRLSDVLSGLNMQMLIYLFAIRENGVERYGKITPAGVLYVPAKAENTLTDRNESPEKLEEALSKSGKMSGLLLNDSRAVLGMEHSGKGIFIPASLKKDGTLDGSLASLKQLGLLKEKIDSIIAEMGLALHNGRIEAVPVCSGSFEKLCEWCDYSDVCAHESNSPVRELFVADNKKCLEMLEKEAESDGQ